MRVRFIRGMSLIDTIVGIALLLIVFLALFGILRASLLVSTLAKAKAGATTVAESQMEYLRGLSYDALGTVGGIPAGDVPQYATTSENGLDYVAHTFISYVDDPADGSGASDENGVTTDYKRARVEVSYTIGTKDRSVVLVSNFAPPGIESSNGGGTLRINVVDAQGSPLPNAAVHITNASTNPTVNLNTTSDANGSVLLGGAATSTDYQVYVSKAGYSSAQTYERNATNQDPNPGYLTVAKDQTTTGTFAIDLLATLSLETLSPVATSTFADAFADASQLASMSSTTVSGGSLTLDTGELYGSARSIATSSARLVRWGQFDAVASAPSGTSVLFHIYDGSGTLIPDSVLPGNAAGFDTTPVPLEGVSTSTYPSLSAGAELSTPDSTLPSIDTWSLSYTSGPWPLPNVPFTLTGAKTIGAQGDSTPIYKTTVTTSTGSDGTENLTLEWDSYSLALSGYDVVDACPSPPYPVAPGSSPSAALTLTSASTNALRVFVTDNNGAAVASADVTLSRTGFSQTEQTSECGSAYFGSLAASTNYTISIMKTGYTTTDFTGVDVSGMTTYNASFP